YSSFLDSAASEIYALSLHDALPILLNYSRVDAGEPFRFYLDGITPGVARFLGKVDRERVQLALAAGVRVPSLVDWLQEVYGLQGDRKSTRLNSSHVKISYAVFCLKK